MSARFFISQIFNALLVVFLTVLITSILFNFVHEKEAWGRVYEAVESDVRSYLSNNPRATQEDIERYRSFREDYWVRFYGLNKPLPLRIFTYTYKTLIMDFGEARLIYTAYGHTKDARSIILTAMGRTALFFTMATLLNIAFGILVGMIIASKPASILDKTLGVLAMTTNAMPYLPFIIMISYTIKETSGASIGIPHIIGLLVLFGWSGTAIVSRSMALSIREESYVELARAVSASKIRIIFKHIIPQLMSYFFASVMLATPGAILTEVFLSVLGLTDPDMLSWDKMISGAQLTVHAWWWIVPPGVAITMTGLAFMFIGYSIENITNPRRRKSW